MRCVRKQADEQADDKANGGPVVASDRSTAPGPSSKAGESKPAVIQEYLPPYLLNGHKFDFRLYVVVAGVNPLEAYLCRTGMVRRCVGVLTCSVRRASVKPPGKTAVITTPPVHCRCMYRPVRTRA